MRSYIILKKEKTFKIDTENKLVHIVRIGSNLTMDFKDRLYSTISFEDTGEWVEGPTINLDANLWLNATVSFWYRC